MNRSTKRSADGRAEECHASTSARMAVTQGAQRSDRSGGNALGLAALGATVGSEEGQLQNEALGHVL